MTEFTLDPYAARSCPVKTFNAFDPTLDAPELDHSLHELFASSNEHRELVLGGLAATPGCVDLRGIDETGIREERTMEALVGGAPVVLGGVLPRDPVGHRRGRADVLVRGDDGDDGQPGYLPVRIKHYRVSEKQRGCADLQYSSLATPARLEPLPDLRYRAMREGALLELAHLWRMLEDLGLASERLGGVIGPPLPGREDEGPGIVWVQLDLRFLRTWSRTSPTGHRLRSPLQRYDHEHSFRIHVAERAMVRSPSDTSDPVVRPIRVRECEWCPWWELCRSRMDDDDISLRLARTPLDVRELQTLQALGIGTIEELAAADLDAILPDYLPRTTHRDRSGQRLRIAAQRARMMVAGVELDQVTDEPVAVPRSPVEVDLDIETAEGDATYLWGILVTDRRSGEQHYEHVSSFSEMSPGDEIMLARRFAHRLLELVDLHPELLVFHYSDFEVVHLRRLAQRSGDPAIMAALDLVDDHFVDLFRHIRDNFFGVNGLGLKVVASRGAGFEWRDEDPGGLNSQSWFHDAVHGETLPERETARTRVLEYNEDDVRATWAVREWLDRLDQGA